MFQEVLLRPRFTIRDQLPEIGDDEEKIRADLLEECGRILGTDDKLPPLQELLAPIKKNQTSTWHHGIVVGRLCGALYHEFYGLPRHVGQICGQLHDIGKERIPREVLFKPERLTDEERDLIKKHSYYSYMIISETGYPLIARIVAGHHLYGQEDPYPESYEESHPFIKSLQLTLALADKFVARIEDRPELPKRKRIQRMILTKEAIRLLQESFLDNTEALEQIEFLENNYFRILPFGE